MSSPNAILHELLNLAEIMLTNGAEVSRVEETLNRMGHAYGASQMNVFAITSSIVVTMVFPEGEEYTQTRRITTPAGTDFFKLEQANALSRQCCATPLSLTDLKNKTCTLYYLSGKYAWCRRVLCLFRWNNLRWSYCCYLCFSPLFFTKAFKFYMQ